MDRPWGRFDTEAPDNPNIGHYMNEQGWFVQGGHTTEEDGLMDFVIDFECYFYGDDLKLAYFINKNYIAEPEGIW